MQEVYMVIGILVNGSAIAVALWFFKRWINNVDRLSGNIQALETRHAIDLKDAVCEVSEKIDKIYDEVRIANGRTAKLEGRMSVLEHICSERHGHHI